MVSPAGVWTPSLGAEPTLFISLPPALSPQRSSCSIIRCSAQKSSFALIFHMCYVLAGIVTENKRACLHWLAASPTMTPMWIPPSHLADSR